MKYKREMKYKKETKNQNKTPLFLLGGILLICGILLIFYYIALKYAPVNTILYEGYGVEEKQITKNLKSENFESVEQIIPLIKVEEQETIYKKLNTYYVGKNKNKKIDINYPLYINEKSAILNLSEDTFLITDSFEKVEGYVNFMLAEGELYNAHDLSRADSNDYIFLNAENDIYVTVKDLTIKTVKEEYKIPIHSMVYFAEDYITYYQLENESLTYHNILEVDKSSEVLIETKEKMTYEELLKKLGIIEDSQIINQNEIINESEEEPQEETKQNLEIDTEPAHEQEQEQEQEEQENIKENEREPDNEDKTEIEESKYIKPTMKAEDFNAKVYTAQTQIEMYDPQGRITRCTIYYKKK